MLPTSRAASPMSTKDPISSSVLVAASTSSVMMPMKRIFMPSMCAIQNGRNIRLPLDLMCRLALMMGKSAHFSRNSRCARP